MTSQRNSLKIMLLSMGFAGLVSFNMAQAQEARALKPEDIAKISDEAQKTLNGFSWSLEVAPTGGKKEDRKTIPDKVIFKDGKMSSEGLTKKGYGTSNYTLTVGDDGIPVFETMQRDTKEGVAFWRGELVDGKIRGVISIQAPKSPATSFGFYGTKEGEATEIPAERVEPQPEPVPETVAPEVAAAQTEVPAVPAIPSEQIALPAGEETSIPAIEEVIADEPAVEAPAPEPVAPEPVKPVKKKRGFFG